MAYNITRSDGSFLVTVPDNTIDTTTTSLGLIGKNAVNFGLVMDQNFVNLLQNFANGIAPNKPLQGQLWYDTSVGMLKLYDGAAWKLIVPPFDGVSGTATVNITAANIDVVLTIAQNKLISVTTYTAVPPSSLPDYVVVNDVRYYFSRLFPQGLRPGINLADDSITTLQFVGTATSADKLSTPRNINITGAMTGNVMFDGSSNVNLSVSFSNVYVDGQGNVSIGNANAFSNTANVTTIAGTYTKVFVSDAGQIIGGGNILNSDVVNALGYVPYNGSNINTAAQGNTIVARDANGNFAANIMIGTATHANALSKPVMIGITGDVNGAASFDGSTNVTIQSNLAIIDSLVPGTYNTVSVDNKGRVVGGSTIDSPPLGSMVLYNQQTYIPPGWALCNGQVVSTSAGVFTTPNLSNVVIGGTVVNTGNANVTVGGAVYIMRVS